MSAAANAVDHSFFMSPSTLGEASASTIPHEREPHYTTKVPLSPAASCPCRRRALASRQPEGRVMDRRAFVTGLGTLLAAPLAADAQQAARVARVGELISDPLLRQTVRQDLHELHYVEGRNIAFEARSVEGHLSDVAAELVRLHVDVLLVDTSPALQAVQRATKTIPIVMTGFGDPVAEGLVASLAHPGGNITGLSWQTTESTGKRLEFAQGDAPKAIPNGGASGSKRYR